MIYIYVSVAVTFLELKVFLKNKAFRPQLKDGALVR